MIWNACGSSRIKHGVRKCDGMKTAPLQASATSCGPHVAYNARCIFPNLLGFDSIKQHNKPCHPHHAIRWCRHQYHRRPKSLPNCSNTVNIRLPQISSCLQSSDCAGFLFWLHFSSPRLLRSKTTAGAAQSVGATSATAVLGVAILAKHIEQCVHLKYGNTAHVLHAKTLFLLQATKRALGSVAALPLRCTACAAATRGAHRVSCV